MDEPTLRRDINRLFSQTLGCEVGDFENFFDLGGDSLKAADLIDAISAHVGINLEFALLLDCPSSAEMSGRVLQKLRRA
ncbi:acyl carrier protein [Paracoccus sp. CPCC 101403]|uniref:Acyl carrier protein n=2 Tax=Paracoccus broussonetiae TaxID=3075834 RepID=A0ABU3EIN5_9RHOB|nr:acyl carrier protein [Paracoccus sp. CPCC 101403]MDT1064079.1 acyl carrier protein [Paracoccus sp. CPCC 101403]